MRGSSSTERSGAATAAALLLVQVALGYEWLVSGLSKLVHGDFPGGLAAAVGDLARGAPGWYGGFLTGVVAPHAQLFGYAIEVAELAVGVVLLAAVAPALRRRLRAAVAVACLVAVALLVNFELANGGSFGLRLASDSFDEGVDLDTMMIGLQLALLVGLAPSVARLRGRARRSAGRAATGSLTATMR